MSVPSGGTDVRTALFGGTFDWLALGLATVVTLVVLAYATYAFRRMDKTFADIV